MLYFMWMAAPLCRVSVAPSIRMNFASQYFNINMQETCAMTRGININP
jgi:hypothetical protein